ncbi:FMN-linked oxidoreductase [Ophiobolus disseminans]|uniref:FMN-linked oxidoreductase n=1 Tax=Ophiobolus disseminans TaxID=1469910 RepID=A0A6A6ZF60_9PLEO|nr:FMN-linked oxidoreductase [Ophiobolus disseminans]
MVKTTTSALFEPLHIGGIHLSHRIVLAPLTRFRTDEDQIPVPFVKDYYSQRASTPGTLLISEAAVVSRHAGSITHMPEFWSDAQIAAWKPIVDAVHAKGSYIFLQLCGNGRAAFFAEREKDGLDLIGPSAIPIGAATQGTGVVSSSEDAPGPRAMTEEEIWQAIDDFAQAAKHAVETAGFDGVEIHACNGHLLDQFIQDNSNQRTDAWGGSIENRSQFPLEIIRAIGAQIGKDKVSIRLSPWSTYLSMRMADPIPQFTHLIQELSALGIAYLHLIEPRIAGDSFVESSEVESNLSFLEAWGDDRPVIVAGGYTAKSALKALGPGGVYEGKKIAVAFGRPFVSNPDLVYRAKKGIQFAPYDRTTFYEVGSEKGYVDYEFSEEFKSELGSGRISTLASRLYQTS